MVSLKVLSGLIFLLIFQAVGFETAMALSKEEPSVPAMPSESSEEPSTSTPATPSEDPSTPATPSEVPEVPSVPEFQEQFGDYLFNDKHTLLLGIDRGACAYRIDPTDVHAQGETRFATAVVTGSDWGTGCRGYFSFQVFQADCESNTLYAINRETEGDRRWRAWTRDELSLSIDDRNPNIETSLDGIEQPPAEAICGLPPVGMSEVEEASKLLSGD